MDDRDLLRQTPVWLSVMTASLDDAQWRQRPAEGRWSALEIVCHLVDIETDLYGRRVRSLARGEGGDFRGDPRFDADQLAAQRHYNAADPAERMAAFHREREETLAALGPEPVWARGWQTATGTGDLRGLVSRVANHDAIHLGQLAKLRRTLGFYA